MFDKKKKWGRIKRDVVYWNAAKVLFVCWFVIVGSCVKGVTYINLARSLFYYYYFN